MPASMKLLAVTVKSNPHHENCWFRKSFHILDVLLIGFQESEVLVHMARIAGSSHNENLFPA